MQETRPGALAYHHDQLIRSQHSQMIAFVCCNQTRDRLITCGEDGEIHLYKFYKAQQPKKIGYLSVFEDPICCADWGHNFTGAYFAVGNARGVIAIVRTSMDNGIMTMEKSISFSQQKGCRITNIVWARKNRQFLIGTSNGQLICVSLKNEVWEIKFRHKIGTANTYAAYHPEEQSRFICANNRVLKYINPPPIKQPNAQRNHSLMLGHPNMLKKNNQQKQGQQVEIKLQQNINGVLWTSQFPAQLSTLAVLTDSSIVLYEGQTLSQQNPQSQKIKFQENKKVDYISWGSNETEIICYSSQKALKKKQQAKSLTQLTYEPQTLRQKLNGKWAFIN